MQRKALPLTLTMLGFMALCVVFIVLGANDVVNNSSAVMILGAIGLVPFGFLTFLFGYGYFKGKGRS